MGALFVAGKDGVLHRQAAHAYPGSADLPKSFPLGSGIVGQAAQSQKPMVTAPDDERLRVHFGFGAMSSDAGRRLSAAGQRRAGRRAGNLPVQAADGNPNPLVGESQRDGGQRAALRAGKRGAAAGRGAQPADSRIQRRGHLRHGHRGADHVREPGRLPDARVHRRGADRPAFPRRLPPSPCPTAASIPRKIVPMFAAYTHGKASRIDDEFLWRKDGSGLPVEYGATPILKDGVVIGSVISFTDITLRKQQEAELIRSQGNRGGGHRDEVHVPGQHEPRNPHADECHHRPLASRAQDRSSTPSSATTSARSTTPARRCSASSTTSSTSPRSRRASSTSRSTDFRLDEVISSVTDPHRPEGARQGPGVPGPCRARDPRAPARATRSASARSSPTSSTTRSSSPSAARSG